MAIEEIIQAALAPCATGGAHQDIAPQGTQAPYIVWTEIVSATNNSLDGASNIQNARVQVDVYAKTQADRRTAANAVKTAMAAIASQNVQISSQNQYEPDVKLFRAILDYSVWG